MYYHPQIKKKSSLLSNVRAFCKNIFIIKKKNIVFSVAEYAVIVDLALQGQVYPLDGIYIIRCVIHAISKEIRVAVVPYVSGPIDHMPIEKWCSVHHVESKFLKNIILV